MRKRGKKKHHGIKSESDLCLMFAEIARSRGWLVFPETSNCDLLLVATPMTTTKGAEPGDQIEIQAKLVPNIDVLSQAMPMASRHYNRGPSYHAVLVPSTNDNFDTVAAGLRLLVFDMVYWDYYGEPQYCNYHLRDLPVNMKQYYNEPLWHPEIEFWTPAGVKSPKSITPWKVNAVKLCLHGKAQGGYLINADFRLFGVSMTVWKQKKWIVPTDKKIGRSTKYKICDEAMPPHLLYPELAAKIEEDRSKNAVRKGAS